MLKRFRKPARRKPLPRTAVYTMPSPDWHRRTHHPIIRMNDVVATDADRRGVPPIHTEESR